MLTKDHVAVLLGQQTHIDLVWLSILLHVAIWLWLCRKSPHKPHRHQRLHQNHISLLSCCPPDLQRESGWDRGVDLQNPPMGYSWRQNWQGSPAPHRIFSSHTVPPLRRQRGTRTDYWGDKSLSNFCGKHKVQAVGSYLVQLQLSALCCQNPGSNQGPSDLQSNALPTELFRLFWAHSAFFFQAPPVEGKVHKSPRDKVAAMLKIIIPDLCILRLVSLLLGPYFNSILFLGKKIKKI